MSDELSREVISLRRENEQLKAILKLIDHYTPLADDTCIVPGITVSEAARNQLTEERHPAFFEAAS